jgi:hypothetical protein
MPIRFKVFSVIFVLLLLVAQEEGMQLFRTHRGSLWALFILAIFSIVALWPNSSRTDRVDRSMGGSNWGDRIDFDKVDKG